MRTRFQHDVAASQADQLGHAKAGLHGDHEQRVISPAHPRGLIGRAQERLKLGMGKEAHEPPNEAFSGNGQDALDKLSVLRQLEGSVPEERVNRQ